MLQNTWRRFSLIIPSADILGIYTLQQYFCCSHIYFFGKRLPNNWYLNLSSTYMFNDIPIFATMKS